MQLNADPIIYDADERKAAFYLTGTADTPIGKYNNEYAFFLKFAEDGKKIERIEEMLDSGSSGPFYQKLIQHMMEAGSKVST